MFREPLEVIKKKYCNPTSSCLWSLTCSDRVPRSPEWVGAMVEGVEVLGAGAISVSSGASHQLRWTCGRLSLTSPSHAWCTVERGEVSLPKFMNVACKVTPPFLPVRKGEMKPCTWEVLFLLCGVY